MITARLARGLPAALLRLPWVARIRLLVRRAYQAQLDARSAFGVAWRRSLQLRVVVSMLVLCSSVIIVLGLVLQTQIADRLVQGKQAVALAQAESARLVLERDLSGVDPDRDDVQGILNNALDKLTNAGGTDAGGAPTAGEFRAVLASPATLVVSEVSAGPIQDVPSQLRGTVAEGALSAMYTTVIDPAPPPGEAAEVPTLVIGQPVRTAGRDLQFYLLFPLSAEQRTLGLVQSTLIIGALVLIGLLAAVTSLVTRQVVRPVRQAAEIAERFADGHLDERMPVRGDDEVARLAESYNEMAGSIQAQIRQLEEFGALQRRFTSDVSHELRTPLTTVRMAADVLHASREEFPPGLSRSAELLVDELDRFEHLLADLLEISRLDAGVAELAAEELDVAVVLDNAVEAVRGLADDTGTELQLELPAGVLAEIDSRRVERIVRNLVANAIDHGEGAAVQVRLAADERSVAVLVRDHGMGLRPGEAGLVFNRFWRADSSRARRSGGTGLGLSIALEDARLHGGWLQAWGEPGRGAAFRLTLPRRVGDRLTGSPLPLVPSDEPPRPPAPATQPPASAAVQPPAQPPAQRPNGDGSEPAVPAPAGAEEHR